MTTSDDRFERVVAELLEETAPSQPPADLARNAKRAVGEARRWPRWLAIVAVPPMRTDSTLVVGSPVLRVASLVVATLLLVVALAGVGITGANLLSPTTIIVAQDGSGDYTSIAPAVESASAGQRIVVMPGTYVEQVVLGKSVELVGQGARSEVVLETGLAGSAPPDASGPATLLIQDADPVVRGLTIRASSGTTAISIDGGSPLVRDVSADGLSIGRGAAPSVADSDIRGPTVLDGSGHVVLRNNRLEAVIIDAESSAQVEANRFIHRASGSTGAITADQHHQAAEAAASVVIADNAFDGPYDYAVSVTNATGPRLVVRGNEIVGAAIGIRITGGGTSAVEDNTLRQNQTAIRVTRDSRVSVRGNTIEDNVLGVSIGEGASVSFADNVMCRNDTDLAAPEGMNVHLDDNEFCASG